MIYDKQVRLVLEIQENELAIIRDCLPYENNNINRVTGNLSLLKFSVQDLDIFLSYYQNVRAINLNNIGHAKILREKAIDLIAPLKKEYKINKHSAFLFNPVSVTVQFLTQCYIPF